MAVSKILKNHLTILKGYFGKWHLSLIIKAMIQVTVIVSISGLIIKHKNFRLERISIRPKIEYLRVNILLRKRPG
jgi:hypothetical protein